LSFSNRLFLKAVSCFTQSLPWCLLTVCLTICLEIARKQLILNQPESKKCELEKTPKRIIVRNKNQCTYAFSQSKIVKSKNNDGILPHDLLVQSSCADVLALLLKWFLVICMFACFICS
jgi:hypothetical protein